MRLDGWEIYAMDPSRVSMAKIKLTLNAFEDFVATDCFTVDPEVLLKALNGKGDMVEFDVSVSGNHIDCLRGDGFIVSTATGSTGYSLAAGGPIVTPEFGGMVCVPVAPHTIMARAFLTSPSDVVEIEMSPERPAVRHFFADGQPIGEDLGGYGVRVTVRRGEGDILLLDRSAQSFYDSVSRVFYGQVGK